MATDKPRFSISVDDEMRDFILDYQHRHKLSTQTKAVIALIKKGIEALKGNGVLPASSDDISAALSNEALAVARDYLNLDGPGKRTIRMLIDDQLQRVHEFSKEADNTIELFPARRYLQPSSAGYGDFNDDASYEMIDLVKRPPAGMSFIIAVDGDSMEPTFQDGDLLFVRAQETLRYGEIGVFAVNQDLFIKEYGPEGLISHNPEYGIKRPEEGAFVRVFGKVLGVCTEDYLSK